LHPRPCFVVPGQAELCPSNDRGFDGLDIIKLGSGHFDREARFNNADELRQIDFYTSGAW